MERKEIEEIVKQVDRITYVDHVVVDMEQAGAGDVIAMIHAEHVAMSGQYACIKLDSAYEDEEDVSSSLSFCCLYVGQ